MAISATQIIEAIQSAIKITQAVVKTGQDAAPFIRAIYNTFVGNKEEITKADLDALSEQVDALSAELQEPLPPE